MDLINDTPFPAELFRTVIGESRLAASLLVRVTYRVVDGNLIPDAERSWPISGGPFETEYGTMDGSELFCKGGVDIMVFGCARAPAGRQVTWQYVQVQVGSFHHRLLVIGDRSWLRRTDGELVASEPAPFDSVPLTYANAFGGNARWDGLEVPYMENPDGRGFCLTREEAEGEPLPNVESESSRIAQWDDRPEPAGVAPYPMQWALRVENGVTIDMPARIFEIRPTFFNSAHPRMIAPAVKAGDVVVIDGVLPTGPLRFRVPDLHLHIDVRFGQRTWERKPHIDAIGIETDRERVFVDYRYPFRYRIIPLQIREVRLSVFER